MTVKLLKLVSKRSEASWSKFRRSQDYKFIWWSTPTFSYRFRIGYESTVLVLDEPTSSSIQMGPLNYIARRWFEPKNTALPLLSDGWLCMPYRRYETYGPSFGGWNVHCLRMMMYLLRFVTCMNTQLMSMHCHPWLQPIWNWNKPASQWWTWLVSFAIMGLHQIVGSCDSNRGAWWK